MQRKAWNEVNILWTGDFCVGFDCICGEHDLQVPEAGEPEMCDECGRVYHLDVSFTVEEKEDAKNNHT